MSCSKSLPLVIFIFINSVILAWLSLIGCFMITNLLVYLFYLALVFVDFEFIFVKKKKSLFLTFWVCKQSILGWVSFYTIYLIFRAQGDLIKY